MKVLVTGAAGFIGFHLIKHIASDCEQIIGIDNLNDYYDVNLKLDRLTELGIDKPSSQMSSSNELSNFSFVTQDLLDNTSLSNLFDEYNFDVVVNLAAQAGVRFSIENPRSYLNSNLLGYFNILDNCQLTKVKHLIYASSSSVYGNTKEIPFSTSDNVSNPESFYAATKGSNELMAKAYSNVYGLKTTGLRFFTVYGSYGRPDMAYFSFTKNLVDGKPIRVFNNGHMKRDFTFISDIVEGVKRVIFHSKYFLGKASISSLYNIGRGEPIELINFISIIAKQLDIEPELIMEEMQLGDVEVTYADTIALEKDYGYKPKVDLEVGIEDFVKWFKGYYNVES